MIRRALLKASVVLMVVVSLAIVSGQVAFAQPPDKDGKVRIIVYLIEASDGKAGVDPEIRGIVAQFRDTLRYSSYRLVKKVPQKIKIGSHEEVSLPGGRELRLYAEGHEGRRISMKVKIVEKSRRGDSHDVLSTQFRIVEGGTIVIGGYRYEDGKLMVAIRADK